MSQGKDKDTEGSNKNLLIDNISSVYKFLRWKNDMPPALKLFDKSHSHSDKGEQVFESKTLDNELAEDTNISFSEWVITSKNNKTIGRTVKVINNVNTSPNTIFPAQNVGHKNNDDCIVSPIVLKKRVKSVEQESVQTEESESMEHKKDIGIKSNCSPQKYENKEVDSPKTKECAIILNRMKLLDQLAIRDVEMERNYDTEVDKRVLRTRKTPAKHTPRKPIVEKTPIHSCSKKTVKSARKKLELTPSSPVVRSTGQNFIPTIVERIENVNSRKEATTSLEKARLSLQASTLPTSLPCRSLEYNDIRTYVFRKIHDETGGCMYISGVPGTGKTATVHAVVRNLQQDVLKKLVPPFDFVEINGLRLTEPRQAYVRIWQTLTGAKTVMEQALKSLELKFSGKPLRTTLILLDELDYLCNKRQDVIYNLLEWTTKQHSRLIVLTIANTMDLPERTLKGKITSRMGLTRLVFQPYTFQQLQEIVMDRLGKCENFDPDAVQLVSRKVAAVSGDARRALDICRRAIESLEINGEKVVTVFGIEKVISSIFTGVRVQTIKNCTAMSKLVLRAIRDEVHRTGVEESTIGALLNQIATISSLEGMYLPNPGEVIGLCNILADNGLIVLENERTDLKRKLSLNVSPDDIYYALNC